VSREIILGDDFMYTGAIAASEALDEALDEDLDGDTTSFY
jgi:hypothetical protein